MPSNGVSKPISSKSGNIDRFRKVAEDESLSQQKSESGNGQAIVSDATLNKSTRSYHNEDSSDQTQQNIPVDDISAPHPEKPIRSIEDNIEMEDFGATRKAEDQREPTQNGTLDVQSEPNRSSVRSSREQSVGSLGRGFKCLAILDPPMKNNKGRITQSPAPDPNEIVDGWGTWRGNSTFVIVQEGPPEAAWFTFKLRSKYSNERTANISDCWYHQLGTVYTVKWTAHVSSKSGSEYPSIPYAEAAAWRKVTRVYPDTDKELRISEIRDLGVGGKKPYRYTSENVAGVFGAAFEDTGVRISTRNPCSWARVEWQGLREEDMIKCKITEGYSWIPKSDFERLCYRREATEAKIKETWDNQEQQYAAWAQKRPGSENRSRATTPCPLNASLIRLQQQRATSRRATSRLRTPDIRISTPAVDDNVSLDEEAENVNSPAPSGLTPAVATSRELNNRGTPGPQGQTPIFEFRKADFMKNRGSEKWKDMDPSERERQEVIAEPLYEIYRATMLQGGAREVVDSSTPVSVEEEL
ncbi:hypothetical protein N7490_006767 [Penicillium lividum]|nr:hypothetical protein N7490_006767 [Penicillium lividum]